MRNILQRLLHQLDRFLHRPASDETFDYKASGHYRTRTGRWIGRGGGR